MTDRDTESAHDRATGHLVLVLFAVTFVLLLCAWWARTNASLWALTLSSWVVHDAAARITRRRGLAALRSAGNRGSRTA